MIGQLGFELGVGEVLSQLFEDNGYLLERIVDKQNILTFLELIKSKGPQARFLTFLKVLARCRQIDGTKRGITQNQELLMNTIFLDGQMEDVNIETALNLAPDGRSDRTYVKLAEFLNPSGVWEKVKSVEGEVMGHQLVKPGAVFKGEKASRRKLTALNFAAVFNVTSTSSFATRFARRRLGD